jgi:hypothetical protein
MEGDDKTLIDCHVHLAALPEGGNGCYISPKMLKSPLFRFLLWKHGLSPDKPREANRKYVDDLLVELRASRQVQRAVLLGMDGVYDHAGELARKEPLAPIQTSSFQACPSILSGGMRSTKSTAVRMPARR